MSALPAIHSLTEGFSFTESFKDDKYYFISKDKQSYLLTELVNIALTDLQSEKELCGPHMLHLKSPLGNVYEIFALDMGKGLQKIVSKIVEKIKVATFIDWSRTKNQTTCLISQEKFVKPYILNLNGMTYSKISIMDAIEKTLLIDESLRLENRTLVPADIEKIVLIPNLSLVWKNPKVITFSAKQVKIKDFDEREAQSKNIKGFSEFIAALPPTLGSESMDIEKLKHFYASARDMPLTDVNETIENLVIQNIKFPPYHPKGYPVTFCNILFEKCEIIMQCWCGIKIKSSKFVDCTMNLTGVRDSLPYPIVLSKTKLVNCKFIITHLETKGTFKNIEKNQPDILACIFNVVENVSDLENCTLESVNAV
jgi:hypothetical protein